MKKAIILIIVAIIIIGGSFWWWQQTNQSILDTPLDTPQQTESTNEQVHQNVNEQEKIDNNQRSNDLQTYKNDKYGYTIQYPKNSVEIVLDDIFERGTKGNPSFRIKSGGHFAMGVWDNPENLTEKQWIDEAYAEYCGGWFGDFKETTAGKERAYSALTTEPCYIEWIIIPKSDRFYTFGGELCDDDYNESLDTFKNIVNSFRFAN